MTAGAAVGVSLPRLGAMLNGNGTAYAAGAALPKRFGVWFWGNGNNPSRWNPRTTGLGSAWELSEQLIPFAKVKQNLTVLSGYDCKVGGSVHRTGPAAALSGAPHSRSGNYTAPTIDHVIAKLIGGSTPFRSLEVGVCRATANGSGHAVNYASSSGPDAPVTPEYDAKVVFQRLFGKAPSAPACPPARLRRPTDRWPGASVCSTRSPRTPGPCGGDWAPPMPSGWTSTSTASASSRSASP